MEGTEIDQNLLHECQGERIESDRRGVQQIRMEMFQKKNDRVDDRERDVRERIGSNPVAMQTVVEQRFRRKDHRTRLLRISRRETISTGRRRDEFLLDIAQTFAFHLLSKRQEKDERVFDQNPTENGEFNLLRNRKTLRQVLLRKRTQLRRLTTQFHSMDLREQGQGKWSAGGRRLIRIDCCSFAIHCSDPMTIVHWLQRREDMQVTRDKNKTRELFRVAIFNERKQEWSISLISINQTWLETRLVNRELPPRTNDKIDVEDNLRLWWEKNECGWLHGCCCWQGVHLNKDMHLCAYVRRKGERRRRAERKRGKKTNEPDAPCLLTSEFIFIVLLGR